MYHLSFYVPQEHLEEVKDALFTAGAGQIGNYRHCSWQSQGMGQFMPLDGNKAFIGSTNQLEKIEEYKVEMVCSTEKIEAVIVALKESHPYETPAYYVLKCEDF